MANEKRIQSALVSVYHKQGLAPIAEQFKALGIACYSTGGTATYLRSLGVEVHEVADLTSYPSILGGRVKTLHPKVHGGILARRNQAADLAELEKYDIPPIDLVIVDLYPFEETVASGASETDIIEKIDIGGIALIRAAAKNFQHVTIVPSSHYYGQLAALLESQQGVLSLEQRRELAAAAFEVSSHYDTHIFRYLAPGSDSLKISASRPTRLRYGENPHQQGFFYGRLDEAFEQLNGKALSYNNMVDIDGALQLIDEFELPAFAVIKHTNPCGCAVADKLDEAWHKALAGDPVSAFGGILVANRSIDEQLAADIHKLFFEVLLAPDFSAAALQILKQKKRRILLKRKPFELPARSLKSMLNGYLVQDRDLHSLKVEELQYKSSRKPTQAELADVVFGEKVCKHLKSNAIAIVKNGQLIGSGVGQTSRIDALKQAIDKAQRLGFDLRGAVLASDAFFPFADSVACAHEHGIEVVVQPGGSVRDEETINFCENHDMCLIFTGVRHFRH
ncbi:MAG: bifunctional phosphoribosylaminoimidazolecarboxamide formyltransferase/IMP cyclohydrolase PurH [Bacteroidetes bacterium]|nr:MAG: bifunctional phosphoribosylaminoimidazolecarboxamide formyltransferase/IMP cyclohydrolase PurH [Bacteroidota bacterium]